MQTSKNPCETCGRSFTYTPTIFNGKEMFSPCRNCEPCSEAYYARSSIDPAKEEARRKSAFRDTLPSAFRNTDQTLLPTVLIQAIEDYRYSVQGLGFIGKSGGGKTRAMLLLLERLAVQSKSVSWLTSTDLSYCAADQFSNDPQEKYEAKERLQKLRKASVAFIDDIGKGRLTDRVESELFSIIDTRTSEGRPTFWTSNSKGRDLFAMFSPDRAEALMRRIGKEFTKIITL